MLGKETTGLIIVDVQGKLARLVHDSDTVIAQCAKLIEGAKILGLPVIVLEQNPEKLGHTVTELSTLLERFPTIPKYTFNACELPEFIDAVRTHNKSSWLVCGIEAHICVYQTVRGLVELGYQIELVSDCVSSRSLSNLQLGINRSQEHGAKITSLEMCLYELVKDCRASEFKQILELIR